MAEKKESLLFRYASLSIPATLLIVIPSFTDPINLPKLLIFSGLSFLTLVHLIVLRRHFIVGQTFDARRRNIILFYGIIGLSMIVTGFLGSENNIKIFFGTSGRNNGLIYYLSAITIAIILVIIRIDKHELRYITKLFLLASLAFGFYCLLQFLNLDPIKWTNPYNRVIGTLGNPNFSSSVLAIFSIFWLYQGLRIGPKAISKTILFFVLSSVFAFLSWSTASVQGLVVVAMGLALVLYTFIRERFHSKLIPGLFFLGGTLVFFVLFTSFLGLGPLGQALEQYTLRLRGWYASFGIRAMLDSPWSGVGVDNYISAFRSFRTLDFITKYGVTLSTNNAHSTPAQIGATFGVIVFILYCVLQLWILIRALKTLSSLSTQNSELKMISIVWILVFSQSLLSIEIIGLGAMNWILGSIILSKNPVVFEKEDSQKVRAEVSTPKKSRVNENLPVWVGAFSILMCAVATIPAALIAREDKAYRNVISMRVDSPESKEWVRSNFQKLKSFTLQDSDKVEQIVYNLYQSGMYPEVEKILTELVKKNREDVYANDLLASYYLNTNQPEKELALRKKLQNFDPLNYQLELSLARSFARANDISGLMQSVSRIRSLAPQSSEYTEALNLLNQAKNMLGK